MVKNILNSVVFEFIFYNLMAVLLVGGILAMIILRFAIELQEIGLAITYCVTVLAVFYYLYNA